MTARTSFNLALIFIFLGLWIADPNPGSLVSRITDHWAAVRAVGSGILMGYGLAVILSVKGDQ